MLGKHARYSTNHILLVISINIDGVRQAGKTTSNSVGGVWMVAGRGGGGREVSRFEMTGYVGKQN